MKVLGINTSHNPSICQLTDGKIDFHLDETRVRRDKYFFPRENECFFQSIDKLKDKNFDGVIVASYDRRFEESLEADKNIFAKMLHEDGVMDSMHYSIYDRYFQEYEGNFQLQGIIHIDATPETCFKRVKHRSRNGESNISFDYLQKCHNYHENWLSNTKTPVLNLNVNANISLNDKNNLSLNTWIKRTLEFMEIFEKKYNYLS